jgi:hypothetical protein
MEALGNPHTAPVLLHQDHPRSVTLPDGQTPPAQGNLRESIERDTRIGKARVKVGRFHQRTLPGVSIKRGLGRDAHALL